MAIPTTDTEITQRTTRRTGADIAADIGRAVAQGVTLGFSDELYGLAQSFFGDKTYEEARDEIRAGLERFRQTDPVKAYGFEILGGFLTGAGTAVGAARAGLTGVRAAGGIGTLEGGIAGAGTAEEMADVPMSTAIGMGLGGLAGAGGEALLPRVTEQAKRMMSRGYKLTPGQAMGGKVRAAEEKMSLPFIKEVIQEAQQVPVRQFRREAVLNAIEGLDIDVPKGLNGEELVEFVEDAISDKYEDLVPKLSISTNPVEQAAGTIADRLKMSGEFSDVDVQDFNKLVASTFKRNVSDGKLSKQMLKDTESEISSEIRKLRKGSMSDRRIGRALSEFQDVFRSEISRQNPDVAELQPINRAFAKMRPIVGAKDKALGRGGEFTPLQLLREQRFAGLTRKSPEVQMAREARDVLGVTTPSSYTAERTFMGQPTKAALGAGLAILGEPLMSIPYGRQIARGIARTPGGTIRSLAPTGGLLAPEIMERTPSPGDLLGIGEARAEPGRIRYESGVDRAGNPYTMAIDTATGQATRVR